MSYYYYSPEKRAARLARRITLSNGYLFHPESPTHGTWTGYNYWSCRCLVCRDLGRRKAEIGRERHAHNRRIIEQLQAPSVSTNGVEPAPYSGGYIEPDAPGHDDPVEAEPWREAGAWEQQTLDVAPAATLAPMDSADVVEQKSKPIRIIELPPVLPPEPEPSRPREPAEPSLEFAWPEELPVPNMSVGARAHVRDPDHLVAIARAVHEPEVILPVAGKDGWTRRKYGPVTVTVTVDEVVVNTVDRKRSVGRSHVLDSAPRSLPKARGGRGGRRRVGSTSDLIDALRRMKIPVEHTKGGHFKIHCPDGTFYVTGATGSDYRGVQNAVAELRAKGVKL